MGLDNYIIFVMATILISVGIVIASVAILFLNNIFAAYWKPIKFTSFDYSPYIDKTNEPR
jgi:hypothetical protein